MLAQTARQSLLNVMLAAGLAAAAAAPASAQTEFTYQGVLENSGSPVTGTETIRFRLYDAQVGGTLFGESTQNVDVTDGVFSAPLNLGTLHTIDPASAWLEIAVSTGPGTWDTLGRQKITAAPFATNTRGLNVDASGRLSVGTTNHSDILHIAGTNARIMTESTSGFYSGIRSRVAGKEFFTGVDTFPGAANGGAGWHVFDNTGSGRLLALLPNGNFGIGVSIPQARLDVAGGALFDGNVGIGTSSPEAGLSVTSGMAAGVPTQNGVHVGLSGLNEGVIEFKSPAGGRGIIDFTDGTNGARFQYRASTDLFTLDGADVMVNQDLYVDGFVGIGTDSPTSLLTLQSTNAAVGSMEFLTISGGDVRFDGGTDGQFVFENSAGNGGLTRLVRTGGQPLMTVRNNGRVEFGPSSFSNVGMNIDVPFEFGLNLSQGDAGKPGGGSWANTSDERLKKNIHDLEGALDTLLSLRGVTYEYKDPDAIGELHGTRTGFIAQEAEKVMPDWVWEAEDGYKRMTIRGFEAMAVEAIREQQEQIAALEAQIESMQAHRSTVGASMVWPMLLGGGLLGGLAVARRRSPKA